MVATFCSRFSSAVVSQSYVLGSMQEKSYVWVSVVETTTRIFARFRLPGIFLSL